MELSRSSCRRRTLRFVVTAGLVAGLACTGATTALADTGVANIGPTPSSNTPGVLCVQRAVGAQPDGEFGQDTYQKVKAFQKSHGLRVVDGTVGPETGDKIVAQDPDCQRSVPTTWNKPTITKTTPTSQSDSTSPTAHEDTEGGAADCSMATINSRGDAVLRCTLKDTASDGHAPYVEWNTSNYAGWKKIYDKNGDGSTYTFTKTRFIDGGGTITWRVCTDRGTLKADSCSGSRTWRP
jgi:peptidoglycan hydrolase-like protein with peptidoglycan-binding domain